jgi:hypothetical protein
MDKGEMKTITITVSDAYVRAAMDKYPNALNDADALVMTIENSLDPVDWRAWRQEYDAAPHGTKQRVLERLQKELKSHERDATLASLKVLVLRKG